MPISIGPRIIGTVGIVAATGLAAVVATDHIQQRRLATKQNEVAMSRLTDSVDGSLRTIMLAGYADIAQAFADGLKAVPEVVDFRIMRTNGEEAFRNNLTIDFVNDYRGEETFFPYEQEHKQHVLSPDDANLRRAVATRKRVSFYETGANGEKLLTFLLPVENEEKCHRCHGADHDVRGVIKLTTSLAAVEETLARSRNQAILILLVSVTSVLALTGFALRRSVLRGIQSITTTMKRLAAGETEVDVPGTQRQDEIGAMARAVQVFKENAREMARLHDERQALRRKAEEERRQTILNLSDDLRNRVSGVVEQVTAAARSLEVTAETMSALSGETAQQVKEARLSSDRAAEGSETSVAAAHRLAAAIRDIGRSVDEAMQVASEASAEAASAGKRISGLDEAAGRIGQVVLLIDDIAEQTNLLALNATIEAARAGEAGKGFAVVAGEVKALAGQTAKATHEISSQVQGVQDAVKGAVGVLTRIRETIERIDAITEASSHQVQAQGAATSGIVETIGATAAQARDASSHMLGLSKAAERSGAAAGDLLRAAHGLNAQASDLARAVDDVLARIRSQATDTGAA